MKSVICSLLTLIPLVAFSQNSTNEEKEMTLEREIKKMDSLLFDVAFNTCDFELYKTILVDGLEFYDDRTGLNADIDKDYASFKDKCSRPFSVTRKLIKHSVHKLGDYGAVQTGTHIFFNDGEAVQTAEFITIWERTEQSWIVKRAISYEHKDL